MTGNIPSRHTCVDGLVPAAQAPFRGAVGRRRRVWAQGLNAGNRDDVTVTCALMSGCWEHGPSAACRWRLSGNCTEQEAASRGQGGPPARVRAMCCAPFSTMGGVSHRVRCIGDSWLMIVRRSHSDGLPAAALTAMQRSEDDRLQSFMGSRHTHGWHGHCLEGLIELCDLSVPWSRSHYGMVYGRSCTDWGGAPSRGPCPLFGPFSSDMGP